MVQFAIRRWTHRALGTLGLLCALVLVLTSTAGASAFSATVSSSGGFSSGTLQLEGTTAGPNNCYSTGTGSGGSVTVSNAQPCASGSPIPTGELSSTASSTATTTLTSVGRVNATSSTVASGACGVAQLADSVSATDWSGTGPDTALPFFGVSYQASGPLATQAITTDGSTGWAETTVEYTNPETFTVLVWLKTSSAQGAIVGFASSQNPTTGTPADHDRQLWIDPSGKLVWGIYDAAVDQLTSTSAVDTGSWVFAAASVGSSGTALYVNGTLVASSSSVTAAQSYSGWWSVGYASLAGWTDIPTSYYFNGSIAQLAVIPSQLSATQVSNLYADSTLSTYTTGVNALGPANYWALNDPGSVSYEGSVPGATTSTTLADASGNGNTGTAEGGSTLGATGPTALGVSSAVALNGSTGYVQTTNSYANPEGFSLVAWFKSSSTSGGTIMGFANVQGNGTPAEWDRLLWIDNTGHVVWGVYNNAFDEITSPSAYNNGAWHMVVAEVGSSGTQLYVDNIEVASNASYTTAQSYTGYWHLGWDYELYWTDPPTSNYFSGSLSEIAVIPTQLTASQISALYNAGSTAALAMYIGGLSSTSYWPLQDSASNVCGTSEITVQETLGSTSTCVYPPEAVGTACPTLSSSYLLTGLGTRSSSVVAISGSPVTVTVKMELSAASGSALMGLHMLPDLSLGTVRSLTTWSAGLSYPVASVEL